MQKSVLIPETLLLAIYRYHVLGETDPELAEQIRRGVEEKAEAVYRRALYSEYKAGGPSSEKARQAYLDERGVPEDFRW